MNSATPTSAMRGSNHVGMRQFNERIVLQAIRHHGAIPKADLARLTQLSTQTVAIIVGRLLDDGLLLKQDRVRGKIGQPSVPLSLNPQGAFSVGIQVGRRNLELLVADFTGQPVARVEVLYDYPDPDVLLESMAQGLQTLKERMGELWHRTVGVGLTAPLSLHKWADLMGGQAAQALARWEHIDLTAQVQRLTDLPVVFAKDTTAACVAELLQGHGRSVRSFLYVFVGTFIGGGLVLSGHIMNGERGNAGAIGSLPVGCASSGSGMPPQLLQKASGWQLEQALLAAGHDPLLIHQAAIMDKAYAGLTAPWLAQASQALAMTVASSAALLDLDAVVMDGSLGAPLMTALMAATQDALSQYRFDGMHQPQLLAGQVGAHARALGGALLPLHSQFFPDKDIFLKQDAA
ncbi:ROK family protein [Limnohabitans sp. G3-2]|uniref:ROK family protein n=1 Tax=Limnohabitans sp. G3-2 TaxID=1100711 RepID=UPI000C1DE7EE|nr:ROK family protein [Limnohabitans sp. G3-2]PIT73285.1 serine/threonine protein kinase [Limnohabitans sp. G3-2]